MPDEDEDEREEEEGSSAAPGRGGRMPIFIAILVVIALGATYWTYYRSRSEYLTERNLRLAGSVATQVDSKVAQSVTFLGNFTQFSAEDKMFGQDFQKYGSNEPGVIEAFARYFPDFEKLLHRCPLHTVDEEAQKLQLRREPASRLAETRVVNRDGEWWLDLGYHDLHLGYKDAAHQEPMEKVHNAYGQLRLTNLLGKTFNSDMLAPFDSVFLANVDGRVAFQTQPHERWSNNVTFDAIERGNPKASPVVRVSNIDSIFEKRRWKDAVPLNLATLAGTTRHIEVTIAGDDYILFLQPCTMLATVDPLPEAPHQAEAKSASDESESTRDPEGAEVAKTSKPAQWMIGALVSRSRFRYEALAVSLTLLAEVTALLLLVICCWPFVRLTLIGERHPLTIADAILLGVCTLIGIAILTLGIGDAAAYRRFEGVGDYHLRQVAAFLEKDFEQDVENAYKALEALDVGKFEPFLDGTLAGSHTFNEVGRNERTAAAEAAKAYPFFSSIAWIEPNGFQDRKISSGIWAAPPVNVEGRAYFRAIRAGRPWYLDKNQTKPFMLESIVSQTTGTPETVMSRPSPGEGPMVAALTLTRTAFSEPDLPAGHAFAVIDDSGNVLFHQDSQRIDRENFFSETDHDRQLRAAVVAHHEAMVNVRYGGEDYRAWVHRLKVAPWTLIILRNKRFLQTANIEAIVLTLLCLIIYATVAVLLVIGVTLVIPAYRAPWIWPNARAGNRYWRLCSIYLLLLVSCAVQILAIDPMRLLLIGFVAPFQVATMTYMRLARRTKTISYYAISLTWVLLTIIWAYCLIELPLIDGMFAPEWQTWIRALMIVPFAAAVAMVIWKAVDNDRPRAVAQIMLLASVVVQTLAFPRSQWSGLGPLALATALSITWFCMTRGQRTNRVAEYASGAMTLAYILTLIFSSTVSSADAPLHNPLLLKWIAAILIFGARLAVFPSPRVTTVDDRKPHAFQPLAYHAAGSGFVILTVVVPTIAFFHVATSLEIESYVKHGQLVLAQRIVDRIETAVHESFAKELPSSVPIDGDRSDFFKSTWWLESPSGPLKPPPFDGIAGWLGRPRKEGIPEILSSNLPQYSEESVAMRKLHYDASDDQRWTWTRSGKLLALKRQVAFNEETRQAFKDRKLDLPNVVSIVTRVPRLMELFGPRLPFPLIEKSMPIDSKPAPDPPVVRALRRGSYVAAALVLLISIFWVVRFAARNIFLIDLDAPLWARPRTIKDSRVLLAPTIGGNLYLVVRSPMVTAAIAQSGFHELPLEQLYSKENRDQVIDRLVEVDQKTDDVQVLVTGLEADLTDLGFTQFKLAVLEELKALHGRTVLIVSTMTPAALTSITDRISMTAGKGALAERWRTALGAFICIFEDQLLRHVRDDLPPVGDSKPRQRTEPIPPGDRMRAIASTFFEDSRVFWRYLSRERSLKAPLIRLNNLLQTVVDSPNDHLKHLLQKETEGNLFLEKIRDELQSDLDQRRVTGDRAQLLDEIAERASTYYAALWATCCREERLLLSQLAKHRLLNGNDRQNVRRLIARGLVVRRPNLETMNESFRLFVLGVSEPELEKFERDMSSASTWMRVRVPATIILFGVIVFFFASQKDLLNTTSALLTGLAAGLPALAKLVGMIGARRSASQGSS
jgi:hypothetical protein